MQWLTRSLVRFALALGVVTGVAADPGPWVVGFAQDHMANDWRAAQVRDVREVLDQHPEIEFRFTDAEGDTARQILDIQELVESGVDVLITSPRDVDRMTPVIAEVHSQGIPVVLLSRRVHGDQYTTFIGASNREIARQAAHHLAARLDGKGRILILQHIPTTTPAIERTEGFMEAIRQYPGIEIAAVKRADSLRSLALQAVDEALADGLEFDAIYAQSDSMAAGARLALEAAGIDPASIPTVGIDYIAEAREAIRSGAQDASFTYPTFGQEGAQVAIRLLNGESVPREIIVDSIKVTSENVDRVEPIF